MAKSELQLAAERIRDMVIAVEKREADLQVCKAEEAQAHCLWEQAQRNLCDTLDFLRAQRSKLEREKDAARNILGYNDGCDKGAMPRVHC